jgi:succinyl-CoA synthetase beta subunit/citryl-CoA synthetase large subunit
MRLFEFESKNILKNSGIAVPEGDIVKSVDEVKDSYSRLGPDVALKAQVPSGGRMKMGGVKFASSIQDTEKLTMELFSSRLKSYEVTSLLMEKKIDYDKEFYVGITYNPGKKMPEIIFSKEGGIDIEETSAESVNVIRWDISKPLSEYKAREVLQPFEFTGKEFLELSGIIFRLCKIFYSLDATLVEVNPLVRTKDGFKALDCHIELEDEAMFRHKDLENLYGIDKNLVRERRKSSLEIEAEKIDERDHRGVAGRLIEFDGDLGLLIGGGGASLTVFDAIRRYGGKPANYCEIGGNPSVDKIRRLTRLILSQPKVKKIAVIMNVVSNTRVDLVARGVIKGVVEAGFKPEEKISVFRIPGSWEEEGGKILKKYNVKNLDRKTSINETARLVVKGEVSHPP